jgi:hypothetical protein
MKYVKQGSFTTEQLSIAETITETQDVILIAKDVLSKISGDFQKEIDLAIKNLNQATDYLKHIKRKTDIALTFVPPDVQEKECL